MQPFLWVALNSFKPYFMAHSILDKLLAHSQETKSLIAVRRYNDGNNFHLGYIVDFNENLFVLQCYTRLGVEDGLLIDQIDHIESFESDDDYVKSYDIFIKSKEKITKQKTKDIAITVSDNWVLEILKTENISDRIITLELNKDGCIIHGYVLEFDEFYIKFRVITNIEADDGTNIYKIADITSFTIEQSESRKREALYKLKNDLLL